MKPLVLKAAFMMACGIERFLAALLRWHAHQEDRHGATTDRDDFVGRGSRLTSIKRWEHRDEIGPRI